MCSLKIGATKKWKDKQILEETFVVVGVSEALVLGDRTIASPALILDMIRDDPGVF